MSGQQWLQNRIMGTVTISIPDHFGDVVPYTAAMEKRLDLLEPDARVVGVQHGLPVILFRSGRKLVLTTTGHLERA